MRRLGLSGDVAAYIHISGHSKATYFNRLF